MNEVGAIASIEQLRLSCEAVMKILKVDSDTLRTIRWDISKILNEKTTLLEEISLLKSEKESLKHSINDVQSKQIKDAEKYLQNAKNKASEMISKLDDVKLFCNTIEAKKSEEARKKIQSEIEQISAQIEYLAEKK